MTETLYGRNAVRECLRARRRHIHKLLLAKGIKPSPIIREIISLAKSLHIPAKEMPRQYFSALNRNHQGVALDVGRLPSITVNDILLHANKLAESPFILALDHLEDPHNVGALLRTAEVVGAHGVILPHRRSVGITPAVVNASAGASEHLRIATISNLPQTLRSLKKNNLWIVGVENHSSAQPYHKVDLNLPLTLVLGSEGKGMSRLTSEICDVLIRLPMRGEIQSLNASVAGGLALYEVWRARQFSN